MISGLPTVGSNNISGNNENMSNLLFQNSRERGKQAILTKKKKAISETKSKLKD